MANLTKKQDLRHKQLNLLESPTFSKQSHILDPPVGYSPITDLTMNLSGTLICTPRGRRLSLSSGSENSPTPSRPTIAESNESSVDTSPSKENKLLSSSVRLSGASQGFRQPRTLSRRLGMKPPSLNLDRCPSTPRGNKENRGDVEVSPGKVGRVSPLRPRQPLEDQDPNTRADEGFRFLEPVGLIPNPPAKPLYERTQSFDDGFSELLDLEVMDENMHYPTALSSLLSGPILGERCPTGRAAENLPEEKPRLHRSQSLCRNVSPSSSRVRSCLFQQDSMSVEPTDQAMDTLRSFKRPEPPCELAAQYISKKRKSNSMHTISESPRQAPAFQRSFSDTEATIKRALHRASLEPDLIGDFTKPFALPLMEGRHPDLKTISSDTLASLISGQFSHCVESYSIIDCRYPYEFEGGHIQGARNLYCKEQILHDLLDIHLYSAKDQEKPDDANTKRNILIFHCEFSSERGPSMFRFLRNSDRTQNMECYPSLYYPEVYLLHGGYKDFFGSHADLCTPQSYRLMVDPGYEQDLRHFRSRSRSGSEGKGKLSRSSLKRLGL